MRGAGVFGDSRVPSNLKLGRLQAGKAEAEKKAEALVEELERARRGAANASEEADAARAAAHAKAAAEQVRLVSCCEMDGSSFDEIASCGSLCCAHCPRQAQSFPRKDVF